MFSMRSGGFRWNRRIRDVQAGWNTRWPWPPDGGQGHRACIVRSGRGGGVCELGFEVGEAAVLEPHVRPGCLQPFVQGPVVGGELPYSLLEGGVSVVMRWMASLVHSA